MRTFNWQGYDWVNGQSWGVIHPENTKQHYDETANSIDDKGYLNLQTKYNPKYFEELDATSPIGIGLVHSTFKFGHGYFEIEAKLPIGKRLWPAFWFGSWGNWPPEIDVFEAYTNKWGNYLHWDWRTPFALWNVKTNYHWRLDGVKDELGGKSKFFTLKDPSKNYFKYSLLWTEDKCEIFYNGKLARKITDRRVLDDYNKYEMCVILNNAVNEGADLTETHQESNFIIKSFKWDPI